MPPTPAEIAKAFQMFDTDSDGSLSPAELKAVLCRPVKGATALTEAQVDDLIKKFDKNGDGVLDLDEFVGAGEARREARDKSNQEVVIVDCDSGVPRE